MLSVQYVLVIVLMFIYINLVNFYYNYMRLELLLLFYLVDKKNEVEES